MKAAKLVLVFFLAVCAGLYALKALERQRWKPAHIALPSASAVEVTQGIECRANEPKPGCHWTVNPYSQVMAAYDPKQKRLDIWNPPFDSLICIQYGQAEPVCKLPAEWVGR